MSTRAMLSPEKSMMKRNILSRAIGYYLRPVVNPIKHYMLARKWAHHADSRSLDWDWEKTNYNRLALVHVLLSNFDDPSYLEIGCGADILFHSVPVQNKTGVDPISGGNARMTSDEFFRANKSRFDVVFIDGLHTYEQVRRDVINSIHALNPGGWIALHDMLPRNWMEHHVPRVTQGPWTGDVWKVAFELSHTESIEFKIIKIDYGVGVIKALGKGVKLKDLTNELLDKEFSYYYDNINKLPIIEWQEAQNWLRSGPCVAQA